MTLARAEFIRRFLIHVLPKGFHRIRHYGLLAGGCQEPRTSPRPASCSAAPTTEPQADEELPIGARPRRAPAAAAACSSSRPSRPAANRSIGRRMRGRHQDRHVMSTHRPTVRHRASLLARPRPAAMTLARCNVATPHSTPRSWPSRTAIVPQPVQTRSPTAAISSAQRSDPIAATRSRRGQIPIAPAAPSRAHLSRVPSLEAFGRRPRCLPHRRDGPASETLHRSVRASSQLSMGGHPYTSVKWRRAMRTQS